MLGEAVGPPIIGSIIGNLVGERVGEKTIHETGIDNQVTEAGDRLAVVIGKRNVDKLCDIAVTSLGYIVSDKWPIMGARTLTTMLTHSAVSDKA